MSKLTLYLIFLLIGLAAFTWVYPEPGVLSSYHLQKLKLLPQFKISISVVIAALGIYFAIDYLNSKPRTDAKKYYAKKISLEEYEIQKRSYTQMKLAELYNSREYQEHARKQINQNLGKNFDSEFSDEDL